MKGVRDAKIDNDKSDERRLAQQREEVGGWIRWLTEQVEFDRTQAHRFIEASVQFHNVATSQRLDVCKIFEMLALPADIDRADFVSSPHTIPSIGSILDNFR